MIEVRNLFLRFIREYYALADINLSVEKGEKVAFMGANGSGKTTLIRVLSKLEEPTSGEIYIDGTPISKVNYKTDLSVGYVPVLPIYLKKKTLLENLIYILKQKKVTKEQAQSKAMEALEKFELEHKANTKFEKLSLFEKYVASLARLSLRELDLLLVDNIFENLSEEQIVKIIALLEKHFLASDKLTSIVATSSTYIGNKLSNKKFFFKFGSKVENLTDEIM